MGDGQRDVALRATVTWVTVTEAARRLGVSRAAVYGRIKRGTATARRGNAGVEVEWPLPEVEAPLRHGDTQRDGEAASLADDLRAERDEARIEASLLRQELAEARERLARAEAEIAAAQAIAVADVATVRAEVEAARRIAEAEVAAKDQLIAELRAMLAEARRPWWRRWLG